MPRSVLNTIHELRPCKGASAVAKNKERKIAIQPRFSRNEDVEFSAEQADVEDLEALARAEAAEDRVKRGAGETDG